MLRHEVATRPILRVTRASSARSGPRATSTTFESAPTGVLPDRYASGIHNRRLGA